jgi:ATP-dependent Zn protease
VNTVSFQEPARAVADDLKWPAYHESSHVCVAEHFGHYTHFVWIGERDGGHKLDTRWRADCGKSEREFRIEEIIIYQAGRAALDHLHGCKHTYPDWHESADHKLSWKRALWLSDNDDEAAELLIRWCERRAQILVENCWPEIRAVVTELLKRKKLTGDQIRKILGE